MTAKVVPDNIKLSIAEAFFSGLRDPDSGDNFYAAVVDIDSDIFSAYNTTRSSNIDSDEFYGGLLATEYDRDDKAFYMQNTYSMHKIYTGGVSRVIKRYNWAVNNRYNSWPVADSYVLTREIIAGVAKLNVFKCLFTPLTESTLQPTGNSASEIYLPDGYVWKYMYTISNADAIKFLTGDDWMPVVERVTTEEIPNLVPGTTKYDQYTVQANALIGQVFDVLYSDENLWGFVSTQPGYVEGQDYTFSITVKDLADNTPAQAIKINITWIGTSPALGGKSTKALVNKGLGYVGPLQVVTDDDDQQVLAFMEANVAPGKGHGSDTPTEFNASNVMLVSRVLPDGDVLKVIGDNAYTMVNLIKNPLDAATNDTGENDFYISCKSIIIDAPQGNQYRAGDFFTLSAAQLAKSTEEASEGEVVVPKLGYVVSVDGNTIYYTNPVPGREADSFIAGEEIAEADPPLFDTDIAGNKRFNSNNNVTVTATDDKKFPISSVLNRETIFNTGDLLIVDNKGARVTRSEDQIESFNFVFEF